jgi:hypothetical protein
MLQNYNKILTKRIVFSITLEWNPDQDLHEKKTVYFTRPDFSAAKIKKKVRKLRKKIRYIIDHMVAYWLMS